MRDFFSRTEEVSGLATPAVKAFLWRDAISLPRVLETAVSGALVREDEGIQKPVYYVSHSINGPQTSYQRLEKLVLALFIISRKHKHYFQTFSITVFTEHLLRSIVKNLEANGRISK